MMTVFWVLYHQKAKKVYLYHSTTIMQTIYVGEHKTPTHAGTLTFSQKNVKRGFQNCSCILLVYLRIYSYPFVLSVFFEEGKHFLALDVKCGRGSNFQSSLNLVLRGSFPKLSITHFHISYHHHHLMCISMYT